MTLGPFHRRPNTFHGLPSVANELCILIPGYLQHRLRMTNMSLLRDPLDSILWRHAAPAVHNAIYVGLDEQVDFKPSPTFGRYLFCIFFVHLDSGVGLEKEHPLLAHWRRFVVTSYCPDWPNGRHCLFACFFLPWTGLVFCIMTAASDVLEMVLSSVIPWVI